MIVRSAVHAMATRFELVLAGEDETFLRAVAEEAAEVIEECDARWSLFHPGSLVSFINRTAFERAVRLEDATFELMETAREVSGRTGGAFDLTVAPVMSALGLHDGANLSESAGSTAAGMDAIELDSGDRTIRLRHRGVSIDLGGIAKGKALDLAAEVIRGHGVECALLHGGTSSVVGIGAPPGDAGWSVRVAGMDEPRAVSLKDRAMSVSGAHGRVVGSEESAVGHVIDPSSGESIGRRGVCCVVASTACEADAWSTALLVLGEVSPEIPDGMDVWMNSCVKEVA